MLRAIAAIKDNFMFIASRKIRKCVRGGGADGDQLGVLRGHVRAERREVPSRVFGGARVDVAADRRRAHRPRRVKHRPAPAARIQDRAEGLRFLF